MFMASSLVVNTHHGYSIKVSSGECDHVTERGRPIIVDFSPVTDFREATCRQYEENTCNRGGYCNFMHLKKISRMSYIPVSMVILSDLILYRELRRQLFGRYRRYSHSHSRSRSRSLSPHRSIDRHRSYDDRHGGRGYGKRYEDRDYPPNRDDRHGRRPRSRSPGRRRGRSRSHSPRRNRSPVREGSEERRAKIEQWNREREQAAVSANANESVQNGGPYSYQHGATVAFLLGHQVKLAYKAFYIVQVMLLVEKKGELTVLHEFLQVQVALLLRMEFQVYAAYMRQRTMGSYYGLDTAGCKKQATYISDEGSCFAGTGPFVLKTRAMPFVQCTPGDYFDMEMAWPIFHSEALL
eukprot:Gb_08695 [translate_table: standard]